MASLPIEAYFTYRFSPVAGIKVVESSRMIVS